ncbi:hypothetical protein [Scleromatobacter humisilvae]|uniref:Acid shock protein n=1 Tax=Scleromatobacter humisilvae TaxID=2897159 RepID=A0A9X1YQ93_9BURK|nr:hypothetical protein [Scleromatobacter humisilvae]MCK9689470.1 hypothetical protein [Scleromatobacter humisilvae]
MIGTIMVKSFIAAALLTSLASLALAQAPAASAPAAADAASTPKKHRLHAPKLRKGATPAVNPEASPDKKGGN